MNYLDCDVYFVSENHLKEGEKKSMLRYGMVNLEK